MSTPAPSFWDRRRAAVRAEAETEAEQQTLAGHEADAANDLLSEKSDSEILADLNLPDPDSLSMGDDFSAFMARNVPTRLRNRALRRLWRSNPVLACVDGLNDYDSDYLTGSTGNGVIATTYQVGKGMLAHVQELERKKEAAENPVAMAEAEPDEADTDEALSLAEPESAEAPAEPAETIADAGQDPDTALPPRRMRFRFDQEAPA